MTGVITGASMITSVGQTRASCFEAFCQGLTGNKPLQSFNQSRYNLTRAYEIADRPATRQDIKGRSTKWLRDVVSQAIKEAGIVQGQGLRLSALIGTGLRELRSLELWWAAGQSLAVNELHFGSALQENGNVTGPVITLANACAASSFALGLAEDLLMLGEADAVIVAGCDSITESMFGLGDRASMLRPEQVQPFDRERRGALLGEGAAAVVLESEQSAASRGVAPLALLRGVGMSCDAFHETAPDQAGMVRAMADAHVRAGVTPAEIDLLLVHGTGTELNDKVEALAIKEVFGSQVESVPITALKSLIGHTSGASGLVAAITALECLREGCIPPTAGFNAPMEEATGLDIVVGEARAAPMQVAQVNAFGFGGVNAVVVLERISR